jgi:cation:H+ antiporter
MILQSAAFLGGLLLLVAGGQALVRGASALAARLGLSPLVVGLTVVAWGTSAPELAVSLSAALRGQGDLALGNVVGSNIVNILVVLGVSAIVAPLVVSRRLVRLDAPILVALSAAVWLFAVDGRIGRGEGVALAVVAVLYTAFSVWVSRGEEPEGGSRPATLGLPAAAASLLVGLVLLTLGSDWLVWSATAFARALGVSDLVIGLTIVAVGTSLPEMAASVIAALHGERELAVGNAIGSNIFNLVAVLGLTAAVARDGVPVPAAALALDIPVMNAVALACLPVFFHQRVGRVAGLALLAGYVAYVTYLAQSPNPAALPFLERTLAVFVGPLGLLVALAVWQGLRGRLPSAADRAGRP